MEQNPDRIQSSPLSDCESSISGPCDDGSLLFGDGFFRLAEGEPVYDQVKEKFLSGLGSGAAAHADVLAIHKNGFSSFAWEARRHSFRIFVTVTEKKLGGDPNVRFAWFSAGREEILRIMQHGFTSRSAISPANGGTFGCSVCLAPENSLIECVKNAIADENGVRHLLLCRVLLGKAEVVSPDSHRQCHPSSGEFDSGVYVDDSSSPKTYVVWSNHMNTHILPVFVLSFRIHPRFEGLLGAQDNSRKTKKKKKPTSPWMYFPSLIQALQKFLPETATTLISKYYRDYREQEISRQEFVRQMRRIAGDKLLVEVLTKAKRNRETQ